VSDQSELRELVEQAKRGDLEAYAEIYQRLYDRVYAYVLHQVGNRTHAEDITAGVFVGALEKLDGFSWKGAGFSAWIFRIARNDVLDHFRQSRKRERELAITDEIRELPAKTSVAGSVEAAWSATELLQAIRKLSVDQQQVVLLRLVGNLSNRQIGEVLSRSEGAVKALQHRALGNLRNLLMDSMD